MGIYHSQQTLKGALREKKLTMRTKAILHALCSYPHFFLSATFSLDALKEAATTYYQPAGQDWGNRTSPVTTTNLNG